MKSDVVVVEQTTLADGRIVQLGGEVIGPFHEAYLGLADELGLTIVPSFPQLPGEDTWCSPTVATWRRAAPPRQPWGRMLTLDKYMHAPVSAMA